MKPASYTRLASHSDRTIAHFESRARANTIFGGASALAIAKRAQRMGSRNDPVAVVSSVYSISSGKTHPDFGAWECPECGCAHLGQDAAANCCQTL